MNPSLAGKKILILEDEFLIALEASEALQQFGAIIVGPAHDIDMALELVRSSSIDGALLDVNIRGALSIPVAAALEEKGVPVVFATGYGDHFGSSGTASVISKPYTRMQLAEAFERKFEITGGKIRQS
jgi:DNA-binding LytR/AlgR family response regulator